MILATQKAVECWHIPISKHMKSAKLNPIRQPEGFKIKHRFNLLFEGIRMEPSTDGESFQPQFGHCNVNWKIENYCLATCREGWVVESPEFDVRGPQQTKWKLLLTAITRMENMGVINLCIKRSEDGPDIVWVNWKITFLDPKGTEYGVAYCERFFERNSTYSVDIEGDEVIIDKFQPLSTDTLKILFQIIVFPRDRSNFEKPAAVGFRSLSEDLSALYNQDMYKDVRLKVGERHIVAHKCILWQRNRTLARAIERATENIVDVSFLNFEAMEKVVAFLYTGDLIHVLEKPSIHLFECIVFLDIVELKTYYVPEELNLHSTVDFEEFVFIWLIPDFSRRNEDCITTPVLNKGIAEASWKLHLYPNGVGDDINNVGIFAEVSRPAKPVYVCLEFGIGDINKVFHHAKRLRFSADREKAIGWTHFIRRESLELSSLLPDDDLRVICKFRQSTGEPSVSLGGRLVLLVSNKMHTSYSSLSKDLTGLLEAKTFSDLVLIAGDTHIYVHKCVVCARSRILSGLVTLAVNGTHLKIRHMNAETLSIVIMYMYSGVLKQCETRKLFYVYEAALYLEVFSLIIECRRALQARVEVQSVCDIFIFARSMGDVELRTSAIQFICGNSQAIYSHPSWQNWVVSLPDAYEELVGYLSGPTSAGCLLK